MRSWLLRARYAAYRLRSVESRLAGAENFLAQLAGAPRDCATPAVPAVPLTGRWERLDGFTRFCRARAILSAGDLYVGFDAGRRGQGALMRYDGDWHEVFARPPVTEVVTICAHAGEIWFGTSAPDGASVWRGDGEHFERAGHWPAFRGVASVISHAGAVICALTPFTKDESGAPVLRFDGQGWDPILAGHPYLCIYDLRVHADRIVGASMGHGWFGGHVLDVARGEVLGGDGRHGSWSQQSTMLRLWSSDGELLAAGNREPAVAGAHYNLWVMEDGAWQPLPSVPPPFAELYSFNAITRFRGHLLVGCGGRPAGHAAVLCYGADGFAQLGGGGVMASWSEYLYRRMHRPLSHGSQADYVYQFCVHDGDLIVGFGASPGCGQVWRLR